MKRENLVTLISKLTDAQFRLFIALVKPPFEFLPPNSAPLSERVQGLIEWAEGPSGCGLEVLETNLQKIIPEDKLKAWRGQTWNDFIQTGNLKIPFERLLLLVILTVVLMILFGHFQSPLKQLSRIPLEGWYTKSSELLGFLETIGSEGRKRFTIILWTLDLVFPIVYGSLLLALVRIEVTSNQAFFDFSKSVVSAALFRRLRLTLFALPALCVISDYAENFFATICILFFDGNIHWWFTAAWVFTDFKWICLTGSIISIGSLWIFRLDEIGSSVTLRIPILSFGVMIYFVFLGLIGNDFPIAPLLLNLLDVPSTWGLFIVVLLSILTTWTIFTTARITLLYGNERFKGFPWKIEKELSGFSILVRCLGSILLSLSVVFRTCHNNTLSPASFIAPALYGALAGFILLWIAQGLDLVLRAFLFQSTPENPTFDQGSILILPSSLVMNRFFDNWLKKKATDPPPKFLDSAFRKIARFLGEGYGKPDGSLHLGHVAASVLMLVAGAVYAFVGYFNSEGTDFPRFVPTLGFVLLLLTVACWFLSGLTFFFDRFRIPVLAPIALWLFCTAWFPGADNIFPLVKSSATISERPRTMTDSAREKDNEVWILVAANGGGIQSAGWTAQVLEGLQEKFGENFTGKLKVISAVSGGSVGTMHYVNGFRSTRPQAIPERAMSPSLDRAAWGLVYPDLRRFFFPCRTYDDRGKALEQAWIRNDKQSWDAEKWPDLEVGLESWGNDARAGTKPIVIFNTTIVETGQYLPLSTVPLSLKTDGDDNVKNPQRVFIESLKGNDLKVVTAVRLSASFPYVTPAARPDSPDCRVHLVDGGYYDNYGMLSLVDWLEHELSERERNKQKLPQKILVVQIIGDKVYAVEPQESRGWAFQFAAPLKAMFEVRGAGQQSHSELEFCLVKDKWNAKIPIKRVTFAFDSKRQKTSPPLSWYLNNKEKEAIREEWKCQFNEIEEVRFFLTGKKSPDSNDCEPK